METKTTAIARINNVDIVMIEDGEKLIAIKPICDILGVAWEPQFRKLKSDPKFSSTVTLRVTVGADGKQREMATIPFKKVFGWLYSINAIIPFVLSIPHPSTYFCQKLIFTWQLPTTAV